MDQDLLEKVISLESQIKDSEKAKGEVESLVKENKLLEKENDELKSRIIHYVSICVYVYVEGILSLNCSYIFGNIFHVPYTSIARFILLLFILQLKEASLERQVTSKEEIKNELETGKVR